ncbi:hypothetical protein LCGC14_2221990 [marine sediment metagenome]|uniref:phospholipase D n=2 Tax=root TaxID=1 RepID=A0A831QQX8_9FLAO|nr:hypothetical protein [Pricia antarctica]
MWFNQAKCDIYMGTGAGTKLLQELANAQKSVKIASPFLSPNMVGELIRLHDQGIKISLITSVSSYDDSQRQERSLRPLVLQHRRLNHRAKNSRRRLKRIRRILQIIGILSIAFLLYRFYATTAWAYLYALPFPLLLLGITGYFGRRIRRKRVYSYSYSQLFPFRVFGTPEPGRINSMFVHGKIYIIDGRTAYLGSLNFTESGTKYNYETRIRVTDIEAVNKIDGAFEELYHHDELDFLGIEEWGKRFYMEPIN